MFISSQRATMEMKKENREKEMDIKIDEKKNRSFY